MLGKGWWNIRELALEYINSFHCYICFSAYRRPIHAYFWVAEKKKVSCGQPAIPAVATKSWMLPDRKDTLVVPLFFRFSRQSGTTVSSYTNAFSALAPGYFYNSFSFSETLSTVNGKK